MYDCPNGYILKISDTIRLLYKNKNKKIKITKKLGAINRWSESLSRSRKYLRRNIIIIKIGLPCITITHRKQKSIEISMIFDRFYLYCH